MIDTNWLLSSFVTVKFRVKLVSRLAAGSRDGCFNFLCAREQVWWYGGCLAPLHTLPAWREDEVIAAASLAPGFQLSARAETAVAEAPHTSALSCLVLHRGSGSWGRDC